jgi:hypothetical protein
MLNIETNHGTSAYDRASLNRTSVKGDKVVSAVKEVKESLLYDKWNQKYAEKLAATGPQSVKSMNIGTSFLVAPIHVLSPGVSKNLEQTKEFLLKKNEDYLKILNPPEEELEEKAGAKPSKSKKQKAVMNKKKSPEVSKTENLSKLFTSNM